MFGIAGTVELGTICPGTGTWNRLQDGICTSVTKKVENRPCQSDWWHQPRVSVGTGRRSGMEPR